jgi:hypothetical protein
VSLIASWLDERVDGSILGISRIILGVAAILKGLYTLGILHQFQNADTLRFPYMIPWLASVPDTVMTTVNVIWIILAVFFTIGYGTRISGAFLAISIFLIIGIDQQMYSNHLYLLGTVVALMSIADAGSVWSIDARRSESDRSVPRWAVTLIMLQLSSVYFFAAITKLNSDFLSGLVMIRSFEPSMLERVQRVFSLEHLAPLAVFTELFLAIAFWHPYYRWAALIIGGGFHTLNVLLMARGGSFNLAVFALVMISMMLVFFTPRRELLGGSGGPGSA